MNYKKIKKLVAKHSKNTKQRQKQTDQREKLKDKKEKQRQKDLLLIKLLMEDFGIEYGEYINIKNWGCAGTIVRLSNVNYTLETEKISLYKECYK